MATRLWARTPKLRPPGLEKRRDEVALASYELLEVQEERGMLLNSEDLKIGKA